MRLIIKATSFIALLCAASTPSQAQNSEVSGLMGIMKKNDQMICDGVLTLSGSNIQESTKIEDISVTGGPFSICQLVSFLNSPYDIERDGNQLTVKGVYIDSYWTPGGCEGDLTGTINGNSLTIDSVIPEVDPGTGDCLVKGFFS
ncbi:hypothetical protein V5F89_05895 [Pelagerythrobacter marensis]|uniref:Uncharacterized protein n=1 Tax=Pelagerythrobacter marensis TaxID=543877 RepID=A0ABZ2D6N0_9SPHN